MIGTHNTYLSLKPKNDPNYKRQQDQNIQDDKSNTKRPSTFSALPDFPNHIVVSEQVDPPEEKGPVCQHPGFQTKASIKQLSQMFMLRVENDFQVYSPLDVLRSFSGTFPLEYLGHPNHAEGISPQTMVYMLQRESILKRSWYFAIDEATETKKTTPRCVDDEHESYEAKDEPPLNPNGCTGSKGLGELGFWGPNLCLDPIVTYKNAKGETCVLLVRHQEAKQWTFPGSLQRNKDESLNQLLSKNIIVQVRNHPQNSNKLGEELERVLEYDTNRIVYRGVVNDRRNTDNAWVFTECVHIHIPSKTFPIPFKTLGFPGQGELRWIVVSNVNPELDEVFWPHRQILIKVYDTIMKASLNE